MEQMSTLDEVVSGRLMMAADLGCRSYSCQRGLGDPPMDCIWPECPCGTLYVLVSAPSPRDQASSAMLGALEEKGALLSAEQVMAEVYAAAHPAVAKVLRDAFEGRGFSPKTETGCVASVALRDLALEPVTMYRRRVAKAEAPIQLRRSAGIETGENG